MRDLSQYPVSYPYGAITAPYSPAHPHRGDDRAAPLGTPIIIRGVTIGLVGSTGMSTGPHCHIQKRINNQIVNPQGGGLNIIGVVEQAGENSEAGKYVRIRETSTGNLWSYFHLSKILVKVGDKIQQGATMQLTSEAIDMAFKMAGQNSQASDYTYYANKAEELIRNLWGSSGAQRWALWGDKPLPDPATVNAEYVSAPQLFIKK